MWIRGDPNNEIAYISTAEVARQTGDINVVVEAAHYRKSSELQENLI